MKEDAIQEDLRLIFKNTTCYGPVPESRIREAETELNTNLPKSYRLFLKNFGASLFLAPHEIYGLAETNTKGDEPPLFVNLISANMNIRRANKGMLPDQFVCISDDGGETKFFLDTQNFTNLECPIIAIGPNIEKEIIAENFLSFTMALKEGNIL